jgi:hypothetical protein
MTSRPLPQCIACVHWISPLDRGDWLGTEQLCTAYPDGIPDEVWWNRADHRQPLPNDGGVRLAPWPGMQFPEYAMARAGR